MFGSTLKDIVVVLFSGNESQRHFVPIFSVQRDAHTLSKTDGYKLLSRIMLPLRLCFAMTIHKSQGQTIQNIMAVTLGDKETSIGLTYVAFSRVTKLDHIGIDGGLSSDCLMKKISRLPSLAK